MLVFVIRALLLLFFSLFPFSSFAFIFFFPPHEDAGKKKEGKKSAAAIRPTRV